MPSPSSHHSSPSYGGFAQSWHVMMPELLQKGAESAHSHASLRPCGCTCQAVLDHPGAGISAHEAALVALEAPVPAWAGCHTKLQAG